VLARKTGIFILITFFLLSACQSAEPTLQGAVVPTRRATAAATNTPTVTPSATATNTPTPTLTPSPTLTPTRAIPMQEIGSAFTYENNGTISVVDWRVHYVFSAEAGDSIRVEMNTDSPHLDPLLILEDSEGERLTENDDTIEGSDNAAIVNFVIPEDGQYTIVATRRGEEDSPYIGNYQLSFLRLLSRNYDPATGISLFPLEVNQSITGEITETVYFIPYIFTGETGDIVSIEMNRVSGNLDTYVILVNRRTHTILAENDDEEGGETSNSAIRDFTLPENGEYIVLASRYQGADGASLGEFSLQVIIED
jgi:hypothetical protein